MGHNIAEFYHYRFQFFVFFLGGTALAIAFVD